jgi:hypothetical protein
MENLQRFFSNSKSTSTKLNRRIMYGPSNELWPVPQGTTEVEVHVWGGGGSSCRLCFSPPSSGGAAGAGGGGGYARARYSVTSTDCLCITVGGNGGTSSVTIATQSPTSPVSATGGGNATCVPGSPCGSVDGGVGGSGSVSLGPTHSTTYCFTASGGNGVGASSYPTTPGPAPSVCRCGGGGGAAGSPRGNGGDGGLSKNTNEPGPSVIYGAGGSIGLGTAYTLAVDGLDNGCKAYIVYGGSSDTRNGFNYDNVVNESSCCYPLNFGGSCPNCSVFRSMISFGYPHSYVTAGKFGAYTNPVSPGQVSYGYTTDINVRNIDSWFYVEDIPGYGAVSHLGCGSFCPNVAAVRVAFNAQDGGGGTQNFPAGLLGGGGGGIIPGTCGCYTTYAGCAGGSGSVNASNQCCYTSTSIPGTPGVVIIYW